MDEGEEQEVELERELDSLYRKVAGLERGELESKPEPPKQDTRKPVVRTFRRPARTRRAPRGTRRTIRAAGLALIVIAVLSLVGAVGFLHTPWIYRHGTIDVNGRIYPLKTHRLTGERLYHDGVQWVQPPGTAGGIVIGTDAMRAQAVVPTPVEPEAKTEPLPALPPPVPPPGRYAAQYPAPPGEKRTSAPASQETPQRPRPEVSTEAPPSAPPPDSPPGRYAIQIRAYPEQKRQSALAFLEELKKKRSDVSMETVTIAGRGIWHRILIGRFSTAEEAEEYRKQQSLPQEYPYCFVQTRAGNGP